MLMVRHALHDVRPALTARLISTADMNNTFFIFVSVLVNKLDDSFFVLCVHKHAALAVLGARTGMDAYSAPARDFVD